MITRSQAIDYYTPIQSVTEDGQIIFHYDLSYFITNEVVGVRQVKGDPVKGYIKYEYDIGVPKRMRTGRRQFDLVKNKVYAKRKNYFYLIRNDILKLMSDFPLRRLKKCIVEIISINGRGIIQLVENKKILKEFDIKLELFENPKFISVSDFRVRLDAYMLQKTVFYGFKDYGRIGIKFDDAGDVVLFHHSKDDGRIFWVLPIIPVSLTGV